MNKDLERTFLNALDESQEKLLRVCYSYANNTEEAKDLFQEVLVNIWRALPNFNGDSSLTTWMYRITLNVGLRYRSNLLRDKKRISEIGSFCIEQIGGHQEESGSRHKLELLRQCVRHLNEIDKAIITLYLEELPYKEIGAIMGLKENTIAVRVKRIKTKLLNCLNEKL
ncbi:RNA polymerase sigma factor [Flagellimonas algicola]|uniref:RNA polymerase sigma factor n=1 Tax=Flagellimonas algicola TaxID=2583815 RepID=A0ABY2WP11_9FLAO|nr:RNA polymerase sigma factor [Allomuricauda algicola]TMU56731.1 RNA polymerase sigma factor [Allomuricauda algicola]